MLYPAFVFRSIWPTAATLYLLYPFEIDLLTWISCTFFVFGALCSSLDCILEDRAFIESK